MATRAPERGRLERRQVARAEVLATDATGILARTEAYPDPWPAGPFPPPPDRSRPVEGRLRIEAVADTVLRVRYAPGPEVRATAGPADLAPAGGRPRVRAGGPDPSYFAVGDSLGTGVGRDPADGRPVATESFWLGPGDAVFGFGETFLGLDKTGQTLDLWVSDAMGDHTPRRYKPVPFFMTTGGWRVFLHTSSRVTVWAGSRAASQVQLAADDLSLWQMPYLVEGTRLHDRLAEAGGFVRRPGGDPLDIGVHFVAGYTGPVHYRLLPYVLGEATAAAAAGLPFARPLVLEFPDDPATWRLGDQFLCGRSILAAPLFEPGGHRRAYLPAGTWTDWWTRERVRGPRWVPASHGLGTMPLYLREGAVIPMGPVSRWVGERPCDPLTLVVAPFEADGHPGQVVLDAPAGVELV